MDRTGLRNSVTRGSQMSSRSSFLHVYSLNRREFVLQGCFAAVTSRLTVACTQGKPCDNVRAPVASVVVCDAAYVESKAFAESWKTAGADECFLAGEAIHLCRSLLRQDAIAREVIAGL